MRRPYCPFCSPCGGHIARFVLHAAAILPVLFSMWRPYCPFCSPCGGHNGRFVLHADGPTVRLAGGRAPKGRRGSHPHVNTPPEASPDYINGLEKERKVTLVHRKPLRFCGPPPLQGGGVLPSDGQTLCCAGFLFLPQQQQIQFTWSCLPSAAASFVKLHAKDGWI